MTELIATIANVSLALSLIAALVFGIAQVRAAGRDRRERLTLETLEKFETREFAELIQYVISRPIPKTRKGLGKLKPKDQLMFIQFGMQMESLGILVAENLINIDLVDKTLGSFVTDTWEKYKPMVMDQRKTEPYSNEYFQWLAEQIEKRIKENPRKPFYQN